MHYQWYDISCAILYLPVQWVQESLPLGCSNWHMKLTNHSSAASAEVKDRWCYTSSLPYVFQGMHDYVLHYYTSCIRKTGILFN